MTTRLCRLLGVVLVLAALAHPLGAMTQRDMSSYLDWMVKSLPSAPQFEQWQQRTGELPPDFEALPRNNFLPDPLTFMNGRAVRNASDWTRRRAEIGQLLEKWQVGTVPPKATTFKTTVQSETPGNGYATRQSSTSAALARSKARAHVSLGGAGGFSGANSRQAMAR